MNDQQSEFLFYFQKLPTVEAYALKNTSKLIKGLFSVMLSCSLVDVLLSLRLIRFMSKNKEYRER